MRQFDRSSLCCRFPSANDCTSCWSWLIYKVRSVELAIKWWCTTDKL